MQKDASLSEEGQHFHYLITLMLSSQTKDRINFETMKKLKEGGLTA